MISLVSRTVVVPALWPSPTTAHVATAPSTMHGTMPSTMHADDLTSETGATASRWVDWVLGVPLRIALTLLIGAAVLMLLRRLIRGVTRHIAEGTILERGVLRPLGGPEGGGQRLRSAPLGSARRAQRARTIGSVLRSAAGVVVGTIVVILVLDELGQNIAPFIASAGIVGVAVGFGAQSLVKDFLAGMFMLLEDQYGVGDVVDLGPAVGTVEAVALRVTKIRDAEGTLWYVPNGSMTRVGNKTQGWARAVVRVQVDYFADIDRVQELLASTAAGVAADPRYADAVLGDPVVDGIEDLTAEAVELKVSVRTAPSHQWEVARALRSAVRQSLDVAGIRLAGQTPEVFAQRPTAHRTAVPTQDDEAVGGPAAPSTSSSEG